MELNKITLLREKVTALKRAPLLQKSQKAEEIADLTISVLAEMELRMRKLENVRGM